MVEIKDVQAVPVEGGFFFDDQAALKAGVERSGFGYVGDPHTPGFDQIRQPARALSVLLTLSDGSIAVGDCAAVQYSGAGGRDSLFRPGQWVDTVETVLESQLIGREAETFHENVTVLDELRSEERMEYHTAVEYGVSQALLKAAATARRSTMAETIVDCYGTSPATSLVPVYAQTGDARRLNAEKMILRGVDVLPHGLFNSIKKIGESGECLRDYLTWLVDRVAELGSPDYEPTIHVDVYGTLGDVFGSPYDRQELIDYFGSLQSAVQPYTLQVEGPMDEGSRAAQIEAMCELRSGLASAAVDVDLVADEWCNTLDDIRAFIDAGAADIVQIKTPDLGGVQHTVDAVEYCRGTESRAYIGGSCAETDISARTSAQIAIATDPTQVLAKPGMGVDEGFMIVKNEMCRTLARMHA